jgi:hypothetical protein
VQILCACWFVSGMVRPKELKNQGKMADWQKCGFKALAQKLHSHC